MTEFLQVIQLAVERDQSKSRSRKSKTSSETTSSPSVEITTSKKIRTTTTKLPNSIQDQLIAIEATKKPKEVTSSLNIDDVLKQYNLSGLNIVTTPKSSKYGTSNDAILASILKEQGIAPPTPKSLEVP